MADSDTSSLSSLSPPPSTDDEMEPVVVPVKPSRPAKPAPQRKKKGNGTILSFFQKSPSPVRKKRPASPPHETVPEDNPDIPFIVMFRSRFAEAFPPKSLHFGPQDLERGVAEALPSPQVESLLCALLALLLNRKKPIEKGHYGRALEEAISTHKSQWPQAWGGVNPIGTNRSFNTMTGTERLTLLKTLVLWSLHDSEVVNNMIKESYKHRTSKEKNDTNIDLSVQPWGRDGDNRRYWLIEGRDDTPFRIYRESNPKLKTNTWWSVAGSIGEIRALAQKLEDEDGTRDAKQLAERIRNAIPRFEATEEKRKRREYRLNRQAALAQPPAFSLYEGRTRGKRMKYTFSDEEDELAEALGVRRSGRASRRQTPPEHQGPTVTASGRHVRKPETGMYGESLLSGQQTGDAGTPTSGDYVRSDASEEPQPQHGRATRGNARVGNGTRERGRRLHRSLDSDEEDDVTSWDGGDDDEDDNEREREKMDLDGEELAGEDHNGNPADDESSDEELKSLIVKLKIPKRYIVEAVSKPQQQPQPRPEEKKEPKSDEEDVTMKDVGGSDAPAHPIPITAVNGAGAAHTDAASQSGPSTSPSVPANGNTVALPIQTTLQPKTEPASQTPASKNSAPENADPATQAAQSSNFQANHTALAPPTPASNY